MVLTELILSRESHIRHIASGLRLSANPLAQIIHNDEMKTRAQFRASKRQALFRKDPVKHFNEFKYAHDEPCFFKQLTRYAFLQRFAELQRTPWNGPLAPERLAAPPNQQRAPIFNDYASDTNYRTLGIFAGGGHFRNSALARFTIEAAAPRIRVDLGQRGI
jgi:hypothetical protein